MLTSFSALWLSVLCINLLSVQCSVVHRPARSLQFIDRHVLRTLRFLAGSPSVPCDLLLTLDGKRSVLSPRLGIGVYQCWAFQQNRQNFNRLQWYSGYTLAVTSGGCPLHWVVPREVLWCCLGRYLRRPLPRILPQASPRALPQALSWALP